MNIELDSKGFLPLYQQIAQTLRYRICTGRLAEGTKLPALREAQEAWGVNLHTVRRAYKILEGEGLVQTSRPGGTRVVESAAEVGANRIEAALEGFARIVAREAAERFNADVGLLVASLERIARDEAEPRVWVIECSEPLATDLADQIGRAWSVEVGTWSLGQAESVPAGIVVGTYFHYNEIRAALADRRADLRFVAIHPDYERVARQATKLRAARPARIVLCETDESVAHDIAADLRVSMPRDGLTLDVEVPSRPADLLAAADRSMVLFSPRSYERLSEEDRSHPRARLLRYLIDEADLARLGRSSGWRTRPQVA